LIDYSQKYSPHHVPRCGGHYNGGYRGNGGAVAAGVAIGVLGVIRAAAAASQERSYYDDGYYEQPRYYRCQYNC
jgi:hypothetical protein